MLACGGRPSLLQPGQRPGCTEYPRRLVSYSPETAGAVRTQRSFSHRLRVGGFAMLHAVCPFAALARRRHLRCTRRRSLCKPLRPAGFRARLLCGRPACAAGLLRLQDSVRLPDRVAVGVSDSHVGAHGSADVGCGRSAMLGPWAVRGPRRMCVPVFVGLVRRSVRQALHPLSHGACPPARPPLFATASALSDTRALRCAAWRASATARRSCAPRCLRSFRAWRRCTARRHVPCGRAHACRWSHRRTRRATSGTGPDRAPRFGGIRRPLATHRLPRIPCGRSPCCRWAPERVRVGDRRRCVVLPGRGFM